MKNSGTTVCDPRKTVSPPSSGPFGLKFKIPWMHSKPSLLGDWSMCGHFAVSGFLIGGVRLMPSKETRSSSVFQICENTSRTPGSLQYFKISKLALSNRWDRLTFWLPSWNSRERRHSRDTFHLYRYVNWNLKTARDEYDTYFMFAGKFSGFQVLLL